MKSHLKIKIKSLAIEARYIRKEERRAIKAARWAVRNQKTAEAAPLYSEYHSLNEHRRGIVRREARLSHLAYAYIRNRPYWKTEPENSLGIDINKLAAMAARFGPYPKVTPDQIRSWLDVRPPVSSIIGGASIGHITPETV